MDELDDETKDINCRNISSVEDGSEQLHSSEINDDINENNYESYLTNVGEDPTNSDNEEESLNGDNLDENELNYDISDNELEEQKEKQQEQVVQIAKPTKPKEKVLIKLNIKKINKAQPVDTGNLGSNFSEEIDKLDEPADALETNFEDQLVKPNENKLTGESALAFYAKGIDRMTELAWFSKTRKCKKIVVIGDSRCETFESIKNLKFDILINESPIRNIYKVIQNYKHWNTGNLYVVMTGTLSSVSWVSAPECKNIDCTHELMLTKNCYNDENEIYRKMIAEAMDFHRFVLYNSTEDDVVFSTAIPFLIKESNMSAISCHEKTNKHQCAALKNSEVTFSTHLNAIKLFNNWAYQHASSLGYIPWDLEEGLFKVFQTADGEKKAFNRGKISADGFSLKPAAIEERKNNFEIKCKEVYTSLQDEKTRTISIESKNAALFYKDVGGIAVYEKTLLIGSKHSMEFLAKYKSEKISVCEKKSNNIWEFISFTNLRDNIKRTICIVPDLSFIFKIIPLEVESSNEPCLIKTIVTASNMYEKAVSNLASYISYIWRIAMRMSNNYSIILFPLIPTLLVKNSINAEELVKMKNQFPNMMCYKGDINEIMSVIEKFSNWIKDVSCTLLLNKFILPINEHYDHSKSISVLDIYQEDIKFPQQSSWDIQIQSILTSMQFGVPVKKIGRLNWEPIKNHLREVILKYDSLTKKYFSKDMKNNIKIEGNGECNINNPSSSSDNKLDDALKDVKPNIKSESVPDKGIYFVYIFNIPTTIELSIFKHIFENQLGCISFEWFDDDWEAKICDACATFSSYYSAANAAIIANGIKIGGQNLQILTDFNVKQLKKKEVEKATNLYFEIVEEIAPYCLAELSFTRLKNEIPPIELRLDHDYDFIISTLGNKWVKPLFVLIRQKDMSRKDVFDKINENLEYPCILHKLAYFGNLTVAYIEVECSDEELLQLNKQEIDSNGCQMKFMTENPWANLHHLKDTYFGNAQLQVMLLKHGSKIIAQQMHYHYQYYKPVMKTNPTFASLNTMMVSKETACPNLAKHGSCRNRITNCKNFHEGSPDYLYSSTCPSLIINQDSYGVDYLSEAIIHLCAIDLRKNVLAKHLDNLVDKSPWIILMIVPLDVIQMISVPVQHFVEYFNINSLMILDLNALISYQCLQSSVLILPSNLADNIPKAVLNYVKYMICCDTKVFLNELVPHYGKKQRRETHSKFCQSTKIILINDTKDEHIPKLAFDIFERNFEVWEYCEAEDKKETTYKLVQFVTKSQKEPKEEPGNSSHTKHEEGTESYSQSESQLDPIHVWAKKIYRHNIESDGPNKSDKHSRHEKSKDRDLPDRRKKKEKSHEENSSTEEAIDANVDLGETINSLMTSLKNASSVKDCWDLYFKYENYKLKPEQYMKVNYNKVIEELKKVFIPEWGPNNVGTPFWHMKLEEAWRKYLHPIFIKEMMIIRLNDTKSEKSEENTKWEDNTRKRKLSDRSEPSSSRQRRSDEYHSRSRSRSRDRRDRGKERDRRHRSRSRSRDRRRRSRSRSRDYERRGMMNRGIFSRY